MAEQKDISTEMYHRIYRLASKKTAPDRIAFTLDLPVPVVKNIVDQLFPPQKESNRKIEITPRDEHNQNTQHYLDIYLLQRLRFVIIDLNGMVTEQFTNRLQKEFDALLKSSAKTVAVRMANVRTIDEPGLSTILSFYKDFLHKGRYTAILDPSREIEEVFHEKEVEKMIPVFGTEKAFEENAQKTKQQQKIS